MRFSEERAALAAAAQRLARAGMTHGTGGNLSVRVDDHVLLTPSGCRLADVTPEQMVAVDLDGTVVEDTPFQPTSELRIHLDVYQHTSAAAVVHAHPIASIAAANVVDELPVVHYTAALIGGAIRVAPYAVFGSSALGDAVAAALTGRTAALMRNHGSVAYGDDLDSACDRIELVDWLAELYLRSAAIAPPATLTHDDIVDVVVTATRRQYSPFPGRNP
ncbi:class II aldolase/adducin family protein [Gordonia sp. SL306]|uniref:class II aldolase/adducin family protein n=1 Tax=Gordonia sp. SL306 TaxID=2995145 RepID=UPI00226FDA3E|nr:class II aldolase/adducin family protein [Gordonia sp. SL306]WAC56351.1 class II aldolase/adducin family protein [Gordonia sp. SL306]